VFFGILILVRRVHKIFDIYIFFISLVIIVLGENSRERMLKYSRNFRMIAVKVHQLTEFDG